MSLNEREMTSKTEGRFSDRLYAAALIAALVGAGGSVGLMLYAGRHNDSQLLLLLMAIWVLSPFIALIVINLVSKRWSPLTRAALYSVMLVVALGSLTIYGAYALWPPKAQAAFVYVVVPPMSWLLIAISLPIAAFVSRRQSRQGDDA